MRIGEKLKHCRKGQGYTLKYVGSQISLSISFLSDVERGCVYPSFETLCKLANLYDVTLAVLLVGVESKGE